MPPKEVMPQDRVRREVNWQVKQCLQLECDVAAAGSERGVESSNSFTIPHDLGDPGLGVSFLQPLVPLWQQCKVICVLLAAGVP